MGDSRVPFPDSDGTNLVGRRLGKYELLYEIASGGMAAVYLARSRGASGFERLVAVKVPHPHLRKDEDFAPMFLDEARLAARIHHPNVVPVLDLGEDGALFLVMDYVEGDHLASLIRAAGRRGERLPAGVTLRILIDALTGLHAAHELKDNAGEPLNIVHRDTSPQNVLVGCDGIGRITDFGIARAEARASITRDGQVKGKLSYIAPEQLSGDAITRRADVFGMGVLLWEALVGQRLFRGESDAATVNLLMHGEVRKPSAFMPELAPLDAIVLKALERDTEARYATAAEFADALENCGIKVASSRQVATCVEHLIGDVVAKRREDLNALRANDAAIRPALSTSAGDAPTPTTLDGLSMTPMRPRRVVQVGVALAFLAVVGAAYMALRGGSRADSARETASTAPIQTIQPPPPAQAPAPTTPPAATTVAPVTGDPAHSTVASPTLQGANSQPTRPSVPTHRPPSRRHRGREFSPGTI